MRLHRNKYFVSMVCFLFFVFMYQNAGAQTAVATVTEMGSLQWSALGLSAAGLLTYAQYAKWFAMGINWPTAAIIAGQFALGYVITNWDTISGQFPKTSALLTGANLRVVGGQAQSKTLGPGYFPIAEYATGFTVLDNCTNCSPQRIGGTITGLGAFASQASATAAIVAAITGNSGAYRTSGGATASANYTTSSGGHVYRLMGWWSFLNPANGNLETFHFKYAIYALTSTSGAVAIQQDDVWSNITPAQFQTAFGPALAADTPVAKDASKELVTAAAVALPVNPGITDLPIDSAYGSNNPDTARQAFTDALIEDIPAGEEPPWSEIPPDGTTIGEEVPYYNPPYTGTVNRTAWPAAPSIGARFTSFTNTIKGTSLWSVPNALSAGFPAGGNPVISFNGGVYGQHSYDFSTWGSGIFNVIKGIVLVICSWVAIRIVTKGGGG